MNNIQIILLGVFLVATLCISPTSAVAHCCKNYTISNGTQIDSFDTAWLLTAGGNSAVGIEHIHTIGGGTSTWTSTGSAPAACNCSIIRRVTNFTFGSNTTYGFWAYSENWSNVSALRILFYNDSAGNTKYIGKTIDYSQISASATNDSGWQYFTQNMSNTTFAGGVLSSDTILMMRIYTFAQDAQTIANVSYDDLRMNVQSTKAQFFFDFDDGHMNVSSMAEPIMTANGQKGTMFINPGTIGTIQTFEVIDPYNMTRLYNKGWDISSHSYDHVDLRQQDDAGLTHQLNDSYTYLYNLGFYRSAYFIAYPVGYYDDRVINFTKTRYLIGRTVNLPTWSAPIQMNDPDTMHMRQTAMSFTSELDVTNAINNTIARGGAMHLYIHGLTNDATYPIFINLTAFHNISDYVKLQSDAGNIEVLVYSDMIEGFVPPPARPVDLGSTNDAMPILQLLFTIAVIIMIITIVTTAELTLNMIAMLFVAVILIGIMFSGW